MSDFDRLLADSLKAIRDDHVRHIEAEVPAARQRIGDKLRGRRLRVVGGGTALAAAAVAAFVFVSQTVPKMDRATPIKPSGEPVVMRRIDVPGVAHLEPGIGALWVAGGDGLVGIDPETGQIAFRSPIDGVEGLATDSEAVFTINSGDPTRQISRLPYGTNEAGSGTTMEGIPTLIAASEEAVWVAAAVGSEGHSQITAYTPHLEVPGGTAAALEGRVVADMVHADGSLWMSASKTGPDEGFELHRFWDNGDEAQVWELSPSEGSVADVVVGEGAAWVLRQRTQDGGNTITRVPLETQDVDERAVSFEDNIESIAVGEGYLWVTTAPTGMNMSEDTRASLHRIDPDTLEPVGEPLEVAGPGSRVAVGYGYVWVGDPNNKQIVQVDPSGQSSPSPTPSDTPISEETEDQNPPEEARCRTFLPFLSTDGSMSLGLGSGGQTDEALFHQQPRALVHYTDVEGRFIDVVPGEIVWPPFDEEPISVLDGDGTIHGIEDGHAVTFSTGGCDFQLIAYGSDEATVRDFVDGLVLRGHADESRDGFALWPESKPEDAYESCGGLSMQYRNDAQETATAFAAEVLGWDDAVPAGGELSVEGDFTSVRVRRESEPEVKVDVALREVAPDCWSVTSVSSPVTPGEPTSLSVSKRGETLTVGFSLAARGLEDTAAAIRMPIKDGNLTMTADEFRSQGEVMEVVRPSQRNGPGGFLILIEDGNGRVVGAIGMALPTGDFAAG